MQTGHQTHHYAKGTSLTTFGPWQIHAGAYALCPDGKVRKCKRVAHTADTWFSIPAAVAVKGKTVAGYITVTEDDAGYRTIEFRPYRYRKNADAFPEQLPTYEGTDI